MEVSGSDGKNVIWEVVDNNIVEEGKEHDDIGLCGFYFYSLTNTRRGCQDKD